MVGEKSWLHSSTRIGPILNERNRLVTSTEDRVPTLTNAPDLTHSPIQVLTV
jgi:hypothetical protein